MDILSAMDAPPPDRRDGRPELVSRRRLLRLAGGAGLVATVGACSSAPAIPNPTATTGPKASPAATPPPFSDISTFRAAGALPPPPASGTPSPPPPAPAPTTTGGTLISTISDLSNTFSPIPHGPAQAGGDYQSSGGGHFININTPFGPGFEAVVTPRDTTLWNNDLVTMTGGKALPGRIGKAEHWTWQMYIPRQQLVTDGQAGVLFEIGHTDISSGHFISLAPNGTLRISRQSAPGQYYSYTDDIPVPWDRWFPVVMDLKYSAGSDGYLRIEIDGTQYLNYSGQTWYNDGQPVMNFGWYRRMGHGPTPITNTVRFADIRYTIT